MMNTINNPDRSKWNEILKRPTQTVADIEQTVHKVFDEIRLTGDTAVRKYTQAFDGIDLDTFKVSASEVNAA